MAEYSGDGGRGAGAAVGAASGRGGTRAEAQAWAWAAAASGARVDLRCWWVARVDLCVEWANEVVCEEIREGVERAEAGRGNGDGHRVGLGTLRWKTFDDCPSSTIMGSHATCGPTRPKRDEYSCLAYLITPINRLPLESLHQIILIIIEEMGSPPLVLVQVTRIGHPRTVSFVTPPRFKALGY